MEVAARETGTTRTGSTVDRSQLYQNARHAGNGFDCKSLLILSFNIIIKRLFA